MDMSIFSSLVLGASLNPNRYWFSGNLKLCLSHNQRAAEISASNVLPSKDILPADLVFSPQGAKFLINKKWKVRKRSTKLNWKS